MKTILNKLGAVGTLAVVFTIGAALLAWEIATGVDEWGRRP